VFKRTTTVWPSTATPCIEASRLPPR
jgi:hypothetical protein